MEYASVEEFKTFQNITSSDYDTVIQNLITRTTEIFDTDLGFNLGKETYKKKVNGGSDRIFMENEPEVDKVEDKDGNTYDVDFVDGLVVYMKEQLPKGKKNIKVTYKKGYDNVPSDIKQLFLTYVRQLFNYQMNEESFEVKSKSIEGVKIDYFQPEQIPGMKEYSKIIGKYKDFYLSIS